MRKDPQAQGFAVLPKRWIGERTFAWLGRHSRLSKDYEARPDTSEAWIYVAMIDRMLERLTAFNLKSFRTPSKASRCLISLLVFSVGSS